MCLIFSIPTGTVFNNISLECAMAHFKVLYFNCAGVCIIIIVFLPVYYLEAAPVTATPVESCRCLGLGFFFVLYVHCSPLSSEAQWKIARATWKFMMHFFCCPSPFSYSPFFCWLLLSTVLPRFTRCCRISGFQIIAILSEMYIIVMEFILDFFLCFTTGNWQMVGCRQPNELPVHGEYHCQRLHLVPLPILLFILFTFCSARW